MQVAGQSRQLGQQGHGQLLSLVALWLQVDLTSKRVVDYNTAKVSGREG